MTEPDVVGYLRVQFGHAVRRPGMHGGEPVVFAYASALAFAYGDDSPLDAWLRARGWWSAVGVRGAQSRVFGTELGWERAADLVGVPYAALGFERGWLDVDNPLSRDHQAQVLGTILRFARQGTTRTVAERELGEPSVHFGGADSLVDAVAFASVSPADPFAVLYFARIARPTAVGADNRALIAVWISSQGSEVQLTPAGKRFVASFKR